MPRAKTLFADDDFENRTEAANVAGTLTKNYLFPVTMGTQSTSDGIVTVSENKYNWKVVQGMHVESMYGNKAAYVNKFDSTPDRLAVMIDVAQAGTNATQGNIYIGEKAPFYFLVRPVNDTNAVKFEIYGDKEVTASRSSTQMCRYNASDNNWYRIAFIFKRVGDKACLEKLYVNGNEVQSTTMIGEENLWSSVDWWTAPENKPVKIVTTSWTNVKCDNILVYEPMNFQVLDASADGGKITLNFSGNPAQAQTGMTASLINLTTGNAVDLSGIVPSVSGSSIVTDISSLNLSDKDVYQFSVSGVTDKYGAAAPTFTQKFGKGFEAVDFSGSITLANYGNTVMEGTLIAAYYRNGELVGTAIIGEQSIPVDISKTISCDISHVSALNPDAVSVFIWQMTSGRMIPVCSNLIRTTQQ